jgi:hypothetical protein
MNAKLAAALRDYERNKQQPIGIHVALWLLSVAGIFMGIAFLLLSKG